jgi:hypothetical protein
LRRLENVKTSPVLSSERRCESPIH